MLNLTVECMTMAMRVCFCAAHVCFCPQMSVFVPSNGKKNQAALTSPKVATALFECSRIKVVSASHTCHLYLVSDPHTQTLALTQM